MRCGAWGAPPGVCLSICLSVGLPACLPACTGRLGRCAWVSVCLSVCLPVWGAWGTALWNIRPMLRGPMHRDRGVCLSVQARWRWRTGKQRVPPWIPMLLQASAYTDRHSCPPPQLCTQRLTGGSGPSPPAHVSVLQPPVGAAPPKKQAVVHLQSRLVPRWWASCCLALCCTPPALYTLLYGAAAAHAFAAPAHNFLKRNEDPINGCQTGTICPIRHAK
jgi:hypothetical protein